MNMINFFIMYFEVINVILDAIKLEIITENCKFNKKEK